LLVPLARPKEACGGAATAARSGNGDGPVAAASSDGQGRGRSVVRAAWRGECGGALDWDGKRAPQQLGGKLYRAAMAKLGDGALRRPRSTARVGELTSPRVNGVAATRCKEGAWARLCLQQQRCSCTGAAHGGVRAQRSRYRQERASERKREWSEGAGRPHHVRRQLAFGRAPSTCGARVRGIVTACPY
jgi:hypothetical protein